ncbi:MAG: hypothetical protein IH845_03905 [Nanoarchaeota archaeon]|nr:hypothetical protein [Nanoarchaeota archaeon]
MIDYDVDMKNPEDIRAVAIELAREQGPEHYLGLIVDGLRHPGFLHWRDPALAVASEYGLSTKKIDDATVEGCLSSLEMYKENLSIPHLREKTIESVAKLDLLPKSVLEKVLQSMSA